MKSNKKKDFRNDLIKILLKHGKLPDYYARDEEIRSKYKRLIGRGAAPAHARKLLSGKYFMTEKNLESILYNKSRRTNEIIIISK